MTMLAERANEATRDVFDAMGVSPTPDQSKQITKIIEHAMVDAYRDSAKSSVKAAQQCSTDRTLGHKIAEEIKRANKALIANLSSMR
jgi:hypothetical protein